MINVTTKQHKRVIYRHTKTQNMKVSSILVINVTTKQYKGVAY